MNCENPHKGTTLRVDSTLGGLSRLPACVYDGFPTQGWEALTSMNGHELISKMGTSRAEVMSLVNGLSDDLLTEHQNADGWTVKDSLAHLARWEGELATLLWQVTEGRKLDCLLLQEPLLVDEINQAWHAADLDRPLALILDDLEAVRRQTVKRLAEMSDDDLERADLAPELRGIALWHRVAANTYEHDEEHLDDLRSRRAQ